MADKWKRLILLYQQQNPAAKADNQGEGENASVDLVHRSPLLPVGRFGQAVLRSQLEMGQH